MEAIVAYMPEPFGTHHSKMMVLLRHDELAQYVSFLVFGVIDVDSGVQGCYPYG